MCRIFFFALHTNPTKHSLKTFNLVSKNSIIFCIWLSVCVEPNYQRRKRKKMTKMRVNMCTRMILSSSSSRSSDGTENMWNIWNIWINSESFIIPNRSCTHTHILSVTILEKIIHKTCMFLSNKSIDDETKTSVATATTTATDQQQQRQQQ